MTARRRVLAEFVVKRSLRPEKIERGGQVQAPNAVAPPTQKSPPSPPGRGWSEPVLVVYGEPQQPTSNRLDPPRAGWIRDSAGNEWPERVGRVPRPARNDAIEALVRQGITFGWQFGRSGLSLPEVDITWDGDTPSLKSRG